MSTEKPVVSVILPTRDRLPLLKRAISCYEAQTGTATFEVVVTDDGSSDGTWDWLSRLRPRRFRVTPLRQEQLGPAAARNHAIRAAAGELLLFAGDDILPSPGLVEGHRSVHVRDKAQLVLGRTEWHRSQPINALMRHVDGIGAQQFHYSFLRDGQRLDFRFFYGSNSSLRRDAVAGLEEPFDRAFTDAAFEDSELAYRLIGERREIVYRSGLLAHHVHHHTLDSFCARQRRAGTMAAVFFRKHSEAVRWFRYKEVREIIEQEGARGRVEPGRDEAERFETLLRHLLRPYAESERSESWVDAVLIGLFRYEYERGLAEGAFPEADAEAVARRLRACHLRWPLLGALRRIAPEIATDHRAELERFLEPAEGETQLAAVVGLARFRAELLARRLLAAWRRVGSRHA